MKSDSKDTNLLTIGWREILELPTLNINYIKAKIDTGARSSAIHAFDIEEFELDDLKMISFKVHPYQKDNQYTIMAKAPLLEYRKVRSSNGESQTRPVILTTVSLGDRQWSIELTLVNRDLMSFRMLLGREAIRKLFLVNPGKSYLQSSHLVKENLTDQ